MHNIEDSITDNYKYRFSFKRIVPNEFLKLVKQNKQIDKVISRDDNIEITVRDKKIFFDIFKLAVNYELQDLKISSSKLNDLFTKVM